MKSTRYLRTLQRGLIPAVLGVQANDTHVMQMFALPSETFWIEASPHMPDLLKERCISTLQAIHNSGVLHGNLQLHNILIAASGHVYIVDYTRSRAIVPAPDVGLEAASYDELTLEMRKLHFLLNYRDCRRAEALGMETVIRCIVRNEDNLELRARWDYNPLRQTVPEPEVPAALPGEDLSPLPTPEEWDEWNVQLPAPRLHIVPTTRVSDLFDDLLIFFVEGCKMQPDLGLRAHPRKRSAWPEEDDEVDTRPTKKARTSAGAVASGRSPCASGVEDEPYDLRFWERPIVRGCENLYQGYVDLNHQDEGRPRYWEDIRLPENLRSNLTDSICTPQHPRVGRPPSGQQTSFGRWNFARPREQSKPREDLRNADAMRELSSQVPTIPEGSRTLDEATTRSLAAPKVQLTQRKERGCVHPPPAPEIVVHPRIAPLQPIPAIIPHDKRPYLANLWLYQQIVDAQTRRALQVSGPTPSTLAPATSPLSADASPTDNDVGRTDSTAASDGEVISLDEQEVPSQELRSSTYGAFRGVGSIGTKLLAGLRNWWTA